MTNKKFILLGGEYREIIYKRVLRKLYGAVRSSLGAVIALLFAFGYKADEIYKKIGRYNFSSVQDDKFGIIGDLIQIDINHYDTHIIMTRLKIHEKSDLVEIPIEQEESIARLFAEKRVVNGSLFFRNSAIVEIEEPDQFIYPHMRVML
ncbi:MAG: hypothetical protein ACYCQI_07070 [Gammaproteobacteria bacterium]